MKPHRQLLAVSVLAGALGASPIACNVFSSLDRCSGDGDCPTEFTCDPEARFCIDRRVESGVGEATVDGESPAADVSEHDASLLCDAATPFESVSLVKGLEATPVISARLTSDETTMFYSGFNGCTQESCVDLFRANRADRLSPFTQNGLFAGVNTPTASEFWATLTADGLLLFLESGRSISKLPDGGRFSESARIWSSTRPNELAQFSEPYLQDIFNVQNASEGAPYLHPKGTSLYFISSGRSGKGRLDIFDAKLDSFGGALSISNIDAVNTEGSESAPVVSLDDRVLYFARETSAARAIWVATRLDPTSAFGAPQLVAELNTGFGEYPNWVSDDLCRLYFVSNRPTVDVGPGEYRLWLAQRTR